jgi:hypothetical protein
VFYVLNEITTSNAKISEAKEVNARLEFLPKDAMSIKYVALSSQWLESGQSATVYPGKSGAVVLCCYAVAGPSLVEAMHGRASFTLMTGGLYDVIATLTSAGPHAYVKRFHMVFSSDSPLYTHLCITPEQCRICHQYQISKG